jgi:hypothetical protein
MIIVERGSSLHPQYYCKSYHTMVLLPTLNSGRSRDEGGGMKVQDSPKHNLCTKFERDWKAQMPQARLFAQ